MRRISGGLRGARTFRSFVGDWTKRLRRGMGGAVWVDCGDLSCLTLGALSNAMQARPSSGSNSVKPNHHHQRFGWSYEAQLSTLNPGTADRSVSVLTTVQLPRPRAMAAI